MWPSPRVGLSGGQPPVALTAGDLRANRASLFQNVPWKFVCRVSRARVSYVVVSDTVTAVRVELSGRAHLSPSGGEGGVVVVGFSSVHISRTERGPCSPKENQRTLIRKKAKQVLGGPNRVLSSMWASAVGPRRLCLQRSSLPWGVTSQEHLTYGSER